MYYRYCNYCVKMQNLKLIISKYASDYGDTFSFIASHKETECWCCAVTVATYVKATVAEGYNGFHARFSKCTGEISDCDCNVQLSTAIQLFNSDSSFWLPTRNHCFQRLTTISTFNHDSVFQHSTVIPTFSHDSIFQPTFSHDSMYASMLSTQMQSRKEPRVEVKVYQLTSKPDGTFEVEVQ